MSTQQDKLDALCDYLEMDVAEALEAAAFDGVTAGACTRPDCDFVTEEIEPDSRDGWCDDCRANTVASVMVLAGVL